MKRVLLHLIFIFFLYTFSFAQIKKGSVFLGGNVSGTIGKAKQDGLSSGSYGSFSISPVIGKATKDNLVVGALVQVGLSNYNTAPISGTRNRTLLYAVGVFVRKYQNLANSNFFVFLQSSVEGGYATQKFDVGALQPGYRSNTSFIKAVMSPGIAYASNKKFQIELGIGELLSLQYKSEHVRNQGGSTNYTKTRELNFSSALSTSLPLSLGFRLLIPKA